MKLAIVLMMFLGMGSARAIESDYAIVCEGEKGVRVEVQYTDMISMGLHLTDFHISVQIPELYADRISFFTHSRMTTLFEHPLELYLRHELSSFNPYRVYGEISLYQDGLGAETLHFVDEKRKIDQLIPVNCREVNNPTPPAE